VRVVKENWNRADTRRVTVREFTSTPLSPLFLCFLFCCAIIYTQWERTTIVMYNFVSVLPIVCCSSVIILLIITNSLSISIGSSGTPLGFFFCLFNLCVFLFCLPVCIKKKAVFMGFVFVPLSIVRKCSKAACVLTEEVFGEE
jgi:hypothetical protein